MEIVSLRDAKATGLRHYFTGLPCKRGHVSQRLVSTRKCLLCCKAGCAQWRSVESNAEWLRSRCLENFHKRADEARAVHAAWREKNRARSCEYSRQWRLNNLAWDHANTIAYRTRKANAMPKWVDRAAIIAVYRESAEIIKATGIDHHVDHIVPLKGRNVCGLHVAWNLQIIPAVENRKKHNKHPTEATVPETVL